MEGRTFRSGRTPDLKVRGSKCLGSKCLGAKCLWLPLSVL